MALVLHRICHEAPDMTGLPAGMKLPLIVPVSQIHWLVQLMTKYGIFPSSDMRDVVSHLLHKSPQHGGRVECSLIPTPSPITYSIQKMCKGLECVADWLLK